MDSLCLAAVLGFFCQVGDKLIARHGRRDDGNKKTRVAVCPGKRGEMRLDYEVAAVQTGPKENDTSKQGSGSRRQVSTKASELETATRNQALGPRVSFGHTTSTSSLLLSTISSRNAVRGSRRNLPVNLGRTSPHAGPVFLHWGIALVAMTELVLSAIHNKNTDS